jgi:hypothetical protein
MIKIMVQVKGAIALTGMMRYCGDRHDASHGLAYARLPVMMGGVDDVVKQFLTEVKAAVRAKTAHERHLKKMYEMLPDMRLANVGPTEIERLSEGLIPRDTASRLTAPVIGTSRKKPAEQS